MKQLYPDLWQAGPEHPFSPALTTHAYLLTRKEGNVLFYSIGLAEDHKRIGELGGITRQYLSHRDEAGPSLLWRQKWPACRARAQRRYAKWNGRAYFCIIRTGH